MPSQVRHGFAGNDRAIEIARHVIRGTKENDHAARYLSKSKDCPSQAPDCELVNYQDGAIVSREIVKKPTACDRFAFDEGQGLSEHTAPFDALVQVLEGEVEITISGKLHCCKAAN